MFLIWSRIFLDWSNDMYQNVQRVHYFTDFLIKILQTSWRARRCPWEKNVSPIGPAVWPAIRNIYINVLLYKDKRPKKVYNSMNQTKTIERKCRKIELFCISQKCAADNS